MSQRGPLPERIIEAASLIGADVRDTPVRTSAALDAAVGARVLLKDETAGPIGSFKARGTDYLAARAIKPGAKLVCASAGNFGQGMARSGSAHGHKVTVFAATTANPLKIERMRKLGAEVRHVGLNFDAANAAAKAFAGANPGTLFIEDCDYPEVAEGAGTIVREMTESGLAFDAMFVPVGGGALANGIGAWLRHARPGCRVVGVGAAGAPAYHNSWHAQRLIETAEIDTIADGIAIRIPMAGALTHLATALDDFVLVSDADMLAAMRLIHQALGLAVEPSAASVVAAMLNMKDKLPANVAALLSGGNLTAEQRRTWLG